MKKISIFILSAMFLLVASCSSGDKELLSMLPKESTVVVGINVKSLIDKSGIVIEGDKIVLSEELTSMTKSFALTDSILNIIIHSGIDLNSKAYAFYNANDECGGTLFQIDNADGIVDLFKKKNAESKIIKTNKFSYVEDSDFIIAWSEKVLLVLAVENHNIYSNRNNDKAKFVEAATTIFDDNKINFETNKDAISHLTKDNDFVGYVDVTSVVNKMSAYEPSLKVVDTSKLAGAFMFKGDFNKDDITFVTEFIPAEGNNTLEESKKLMGKPSDKFLKLIPKNVDGVYAFTLNGEELIKVNEVSNAIAMLPVENYGMNKADLIKMITDINGAISLSVANVSYNNSTIQYYCSIESKDSKFILDTITKLISQMGIKPQINGDEVIYSLGSINATLGVKDGLFYCNVNGVKPAETGEANSVLGDIFSESQYGMYINLEKDGNIAKNIATDGVFTMPGYFKMSLGSDWSINTQYVLTNNTHKNSLQALINQIHQLKKYEDQKRAELDEFYDNEIVEID